MAASETNTFMLLYASTFIFEYKIKTMQNKKCDLYCVYITYLDKSNFYVHNYITQLNFLFEWSDSRFLSM